MTTTKIKRDNLKKLIFDVWNNSKKRYGAPKIYQELLKSGEKCSLRHVQNLMQEQGIVSITVKKFRPQRTKKLTEDETVLNLLNQDFSAEQINEKWVGDITYIHTKRDGWCYLSSFMDLYNNEIIGWNFSKEMTSELVIKSLEMACAKRGRVEGVIVHTDRGSQYTSKAFNEEMKKKGLKSSYSRKGNPYDNACIESFHSVLKKELVHHKEYEDYEEALTSVCEYIEDWYNKKRIQKKLNWLTPEEFLKSA